MSWLILVESMSVQHTLPQLCGLRCHRPPGHHRESTQKKPPSAAAAAASVAQRRPQPHQRLPAGTQHDAGNASSLLSLHVALSHGPRCGGNLHIKVKLYGWCWILRSKRAFSSIRWSTTETKFSFWSNRQNLTVTFWRAFSVSASPLCGAQMCTNAIRWESGVVTGKPPLRDPANAKFFCAMPKPAFAAACSHSTDLVITMQWHLS